MNLFTACLASAAIVLGSPFMGQLQSFLRRSLSTRNYVLLFGVGVLVAVGLAISLAFFRIRSRRRLRFALLAIALAAGGAYMWANGTPYPEVNAVERVHFVEYGLVGFLFYRVWRNTGDPSAIVLPLLAGFLVGTLDEWLQWFIPVRVGEAHDVFLNLVSIACGLLFAVALLPPPSFTLRPVPGSLRRMCAVATIAWLAFAAFVSQVHLGYTIDEPGIGQFHSHYTPTQLDALQQDRLQRWQADPPLRLRRLSREDQYLDEGLWHVRRRNLADDGEQWRENLILERYFNPVLDIPTYASPKGNRWGPDQRVNLQVRVAQVPMPFISAAEPYPIVSWSKTTYVTTVLIVATVLMSGVFFSAKGSR
jgi:VanZ like family